MDVERRLGDDVAKRRAGDFDRERLVEPDAFVADAVHAEGGAGEEHRKDDHRQSRPAAEA